jgi:hypothetical protein
MMWEEAANDVSIGNNVLPVPCVLMPLCMKEPYAWFTNIIIT